MFRNFFVVALRQWSRNRLAAIINLVGLTIAISVAIMSFIFANSYATQDAFHTKRDRLFLIESIIDPGNAPEHWGVAPTPMGHMMVQDLPEVEAAIRFRNRAIVVRGEEENTQIGATFTDAAFFDYLDFPLKEGNAQSFDNPLTIFLSEETANLYFPDGTATGKPMELVVGAGQHVEVTVGGVFERQPVNSTIQFNALLPYSNLESWFDSDNTSWDGWTRATMIALCEGASIDDVRGKLDKYLQLQNEANPEWAVDEFYLDPFTESAYNARSQRSSFQVTESPGGVLVVSVIGVILLLLASFNYANNSLVLVSRRFREIGIRKIVGGTRHQMIVQFVGENILFMFVATLLAIAVSEAFIFPLWNSIFPHASFNMGMVLNSHGVLFLAAVLLTAGIGTGLYPALVVSRFQPVEIFRGAKRNVGYGLSVRILTGVQIALTFGLLFFSGYLHANHIYQRNIDWGYKPSNIVWSFVEEPDAAETILTELASDPSVEKAFAVRDHIGTGWHLQALVMDEVRWDVAGFGVVPDYMETMGYRLLDGKFFDPVSGDQSGGTEAVINTELAVTLGLNSPIGTTITLDGQPLTIVGVVEGAVNNGLLRTRHPAIYFVAPKSEASRIVVKATTGHAIDAAESLRHVKRKILPDRTDQVNYQDENFAGVYQAFHRISSVMNFSALMALLISLMGLFGLISSQLSNRERELAVRRVLGARLQEVISLVTWPFVRLFLIATGVIIAPAWLLTMLYAKNNYADLSPMPAVVPIGVAVLMLALIVGTLLSQITLVTRRNPSSVLRDE